MHKDIMLEKFFLSYGDTKKVYLKSLSMDVYISDKLNDDIIKLFSQSKYKEILPFISKLIKNGKIVPFVYSKSTLRELFSHISSSILDPFMNRNNLKHQLFYAFYTPDENKVYIAISNITNLFSYANNEFVASIIIHELMHYSASNINKQFYSIWYTTFFRFYTLTFEFYMLITKNYNREIEIACEKLSKQLISIASDMENFHKNFDSNVRKLIQFYYNIPKRLKELIPNIQVRFSHYYKYISITSILIANLIMYALRSDMDKLSDLIQKHFVYVLYNLVQSYNSFDKNNKFYKKTLFYQEYFLTSEIAAILSMGDKYLYHVYKTLKILANKEG